MLTRCLVAACLILTTAAAAQPIHPWEPAHEKPLRSWIGPRLLEQMSEQLTLSDAQERQLQHIAQEHEARFAAFVSEVDPVVQEFADRLKRTRVSTVERLEITLEREEALAPIADAQARLDRQFFEEVKTILAEPQLEQFDAFMCRFNRDRWLNGASFLEQSIDLVELVESLAERTERDVQELGVSELLKQYATEMDQQLRARAAARIKKARNWESNLAERYETDGERVWIGPHPRGNDGFNREFRMRRRLDEHVRNVNRKYLEIIAGALPESHSATFRKLYNEQVVDAADFRGPGRLRFRKQAQCAGALENLTAEQRERLELLQTDYDVRFEQAVAELIRRHNRNAIDGITSDLEETEMLETRLDEARQRLQDMDARLLDELHDLLTPDQREAVRTGEACASLEN